MSRIHVVAQGECLVRIAHRYGFRDHHALYDHPDNAGLRQKRPDPNLLFPGDEVVIPDWETKAVAVATEQTHRFQVKREERRLGLRFLPRRDVSYENVAYRLYVDGALFEDGARTDGSGEIEVTIPADAETARIEAEGYAWDLRIADLNPVQDTADEGVSGLLGRLYNLGYDIGPIDEGLSPRARAMIRWFQRDSGLDPTGELTDETKAAILTAHGA